MSGSPHRREGCAQTTSRTSQIPIHPVNDSGSRHFTAEADSFSNTPYINRLNPAAHSYGAPDWHIPVYDDRNIRRNAPSNQESFEHLPIQRRSHLPIEEPRDRFGDSDDTLRDAAEDRRYSLSSYDHPYDINPPPNAYSGRSPALPPQRPPRSTLRRRQSVSFVGHPSPDDDDHHDIERGEGPGSREPQYGRGRGVLSHLMEWHHNEHRPDNDVRDTPSTNRRPHYFRGPSETYTEFSMGIDRESLHREDSMASLYSQIMDDDDPRVTGVRGYLEDPVDEKRNALRQMDYRARRKERAKVRIEFNITCELDRHSLLLFSAHPLLQQS